MSSLVTSKWRASRCISASRCRVLRRSLSWQKRCARIVVPTPSGLWTSTYSSCFLSPVWADTLLCKAIEDGSASARGPLFGNSRADVEWFTDWLQSRPATCRTSWVVSRNSFPNGAYDPVWYSEKQVKKTAQSITFSPERTSGLEQRRRRNFALTTTITSASRCRARLAAIPGVGGK